MAYTFHLLDLLSILLAAPAVAFMAWVFWNLTVQIRHEVRTRVTPPEATWTPEPVDDRQTVKGRVFDGTEAHLWTPDQVSAITRRGKVETSERRFASRTSH
jgi:hypothetical protein